MIEAAVTASGSRVDRGARRPRRLRLVLRRNLSEGTALRADLAAPRLHFSVLALVGAALVLLGAASGAALKTRTAAPSPAAAPVLPAEVVALAAEAKVGGLMTLEIGAGGRIVCYSAQVDLSAVPLACLETARTAVPGGRIVSAEKQVVNGVTYYEIEEDDDDLRVELLLTPDGRLAGREDELVAGTAPARVLAAANAAVPEGTLAAVELVQGPETLGGLEYHVKKDVGGEILRIRITDRGAVEVLRKLRTELRLPR